MPVALRQPRADGAYQRHDQHQVMGQKLFAVQPEHGGQRGEDQRRPEAAREHDQQRQIDALGQKQRRLLPVAGEVKTERPQHQPAGAPGQHNKQREDDVPQGAPHQWPVSSWWSRAKCTSSMVLLHCSLPSTLARCTWTVLWLSSSLKAISFTLSP